MNQQIFEEIQALKRKILPNERVILFGSQARGDARPDSDWDLLVLLDKQEREFGKDFDNYAYPFKEIGLKHNVLVNTKIFTLKDWERQKPSIFHKNVEHDKIEL
jgi:predicted nucleotidyltransferase